MKQKTLVRKEGKKWISGNEISQCYKNVNSPRANLKFNAFSIKIQQNFYGTCQTDYKIHLGGWKCFQIPKTILKIINYMEVWSGKIILW